MRPRSGRRWSPNLARAAKNSKICTSSSARRGPTSTRTPGITSSAPPRPRPRCAATAWRSTRSPSGRACCATSPRSIASVEAVRPQIAAAGGAGAGRRGSRSFDPGGAASVARGAGTFGAAHMLSSVSEPGLEKVAESRTGCDAHVSALCSRRRRLCRGPRQPGHRQGIHRVLPDGRYRALQPARARHRQALRARQPDAAPPAATSSRRLDGAPSS